MSFFEFNVFLQNISSTPHFWGAAKREIFKQKKIKIIIQKSF